MGDMRRHAIVVTDHGYGNFLKLAHKKAIEIFPWVSQISEPQINGERSFFIPPDGSKEGWPDSDVGDARRDKFVAFLHTTKHEDKSSPLSWVEVQFGDDNGEVKVVRSNKDEDANSLLHCDIDAAKRERDWLQQDAAEKPAKVSKERKRKREQKPDEDGAL